MFSPEDEHDSRAAFPEEQPRTVSKRAFEALSWTLFLVLEIAGLLGATEVSRRMDFRLPPRSFWLVTIIAFVLSRVGADRIFKMFGTSRSGTVVEIWGRKASSAETAPYDATVDVRPLEEPRKKGRPYFPVFMIILIVGFLIFSPFAHRILLPAILLLAIFSGLIVLERWPAKEVFAARADGRGITGFPTGFHVGRKFVPWSEVETCEIETIHDTFGSPILLRPVFKDRDGRKLMTLNLQSTRFDDQERLAAYIRARLPEPRENLDAW